MFSTPLTPLIKGGDEGTLLGEGEGSLSVGGGEVLTTSVYIFTKDRQSINILTSSVFLKMWAKNLLNKINSIVMLNIIFLQIKINIL